MPDILEFLKLLKKWYVYGKLVYFEHNIAESSTFRGICKEGKLGQVK